MWCAPGQVCGAQPCPSLTSGPWGPSHRQAGAEQSRDALSVLPSVTVDDDRVQGAETVTLEQCHQSLVIDSGQCGQLGGEASTRCMHTYLVWVPVHGHREMQVGGDGDWSPENSLLGYAQVLGHVEGGAACGCGCETQETAHSQAFPQHLCRSRAVKMPTLPFLISPVPRQRLPCRHVGSKVGSCGTTERGNGLRQHRQRPLGAAERGRQGSWPQLQPVPQVTASAHAPGLPAPVESKVRTTAQALPAVPKGLAL